MFPNTCLPIFLIVPYKRSSGSKKNLNIENDDDLGDDNKDDARQADYIRKAFNSDKTTEILHYNRHEISIIEMITFQIWLFYYEFYNGLNWGVSMKKYKTFFFSIWAVLTYSSWHKYIFDRKSPTVRHLGTGAVMYIIFFFYFFCVIKWIEFGWKIHSLKHIMYMYSGLPIHVYTTCTCI